MASLRVIHGESTGTLFPLIAERNVLGRHPNCQVVLESAVVSRHHAQVLESHGTFYVEDLRSRNGTYLNNQKIESRTELKQGDRIRLSDIELEFENLAPNSTLPPKPETPVLELEHFPFDHLDPAILDRSVFVPTGTGEQINLDHSIVGHRSTSLDHREIRLKATVDPLVKLKAILEFSQALGRDLQTESVLPKMLVTLFNIFPQAEQGFVLLKDSESDKLKIKASRTRQGDESEIIAVSMTVVRHAMESREAVLSRNILDDSRFKKSTALSRMRIASVLCVPMLTPEDEALGVIQIVTRDSDRAFNEEDLDLLSSLAVQASMAVENARLHEEQILRRDLERDLEFATQVQLGFLPKSRPVIPNYSFGDYYEAALSVGGDYFDYIMMPDGRVAMTIGDVAGKGMPAALLMARLYSSMRYQLLSKSRCEDAVSGLNEELASGGLGHRFITFLLMLIDPSQHTMTIVNAGHLPPLRRTKSGEVIPLGQMQTNLPLGIMPDLHYEALTVPIFEGDTILAYTDGVTEAMTEEREIYGQQRLQKFFSKTSGEVSEVISQLVEDVEHFTQDAANRDDTCLVGVKRTTT